jgi:RNA recognition motif-containing protein
LGGVLVFFRSLGMSKKLYVGNLPFSTTGESLEQLFSEHGEVLSARIIKDRQTGRSRGFGFVEMEDQAADKAMEALNGQEFEGRTLRIGEAREQNSAPNRTE